MPNTSRRAALARLCALVGAAATASALDACRFSPYHFAGGGLPSNIRTIAVLPFDNQTPIPELQRDLFETLRRELQNRLNLREASEAKADAIVRGTIVKYDADVPIAYSANPGQSTQARRQLQIVVDVAIIDQASGRTLLDKKALTQKADYPERAEQQGRAQAISQIANDVIEAAQSNW